MPEQNNQPPVDQDQISQEPISGNVWSEPALTTSAQSQTQVPAQESISIADPQDPTTGVTPNTDDFSKQLNRIETTLATISEKSDSTDSSREIKQDVNRIVDGLRGLRDRVEQLASEESVANIKEEWKEWQNQVIKILKTANNGIEGAKTTFNHSVNQLKQDTETQYKSNIEGERRRADAAEDKVLESVVYPLHDAAFKISCDIESGGRIAEGQSVCNLLEVLESNLRESLDIRVFRPSPGEKNRLDCMQPVGFEKTSLFFRKADTVANTITCGFYREESLNAPRFLRKARVVVYRDEGSAVIPDPAPSPPLTLTEDSNKRENS